MEICCAVRHLDGLGVDVGQRRRVRLSGQASGVLTIPSRTPSMLSHWRVTSEASRETSAGERRFGEVMGRLNYPTMSANNCLFGKW